MTDTRYVTDEPERYRLFVLCECTECEGKGKATYPMQLARWEVEYGELTTDRCPVCRGEGRERRELTSVPDEESVGVALVQLARDGEFENGCQFGLLDSQGPKGKKWLVLPWPDTARTVSAAGRTLAKSKTKAHTD